jgi:SAM-dependent methyltransferase
LRSDRPAADETALTQSTFGRALSALLPLLICPECRGDLARQGASLTCVTCSRTYGIVDEIPLLAQTGSSELWGVASDGQSSTAYQEHFLKTDIGETYQRKYERGWSKRCATRREISRIETLLASQPRSSRFLDIPCGGGRVSRPLVNATDLLLQADLSLSQVAMARRRMGAHGNTAWFTASAFLIPLRDGSVDATLCNRLTHHLPLVAEQERLIGELLRVSRHFVILSYYDHGSFKSLGRRLRGKYPGHTMKRDDLRARVERYGAFVKVDIPLWFGRSRLRYALLQKIQVSPPDRSFGDVGMPVKTGRE